MTAATEYEHRIRECRESESVHRNRARLTSIIGYSMIVLFFANLWAARPLTLLLPLAISAVFIKWSDHLAKIQKQQSVAATFYEQGVNRIAGNWAGRGDTNSFADEAHLYARDLDIFGKGSLFELLCTARTYAGATTLAEWLCSGANPSEIVKRQNAVRELQSMTDLRESLAVSRMEVQRRSLGSALIEWTRRPIPSESPRARWVAASLGALLVGVLLTGIVFRYDAVPFAGVVVLGEIAFSLRFYNRRHRVLEFVDELHEELKILRGTFARIERQRFSSPKLRELQAELQVSSDSASIRLAGLIKLINRVLVARTVWPVTGFVLLTTQVAFTVEQWQRQTSEAFPRWIHALGELEALCSLAAFAFEHPETTFPEIIPGEGLFEAREMRHPLLHATTCVPNSMALGTRVQLLIVSGSNMSGKSTLLRTIGTNIVLAQAGSTVCAAEMRMSPMAIGASIRIQDSLQGGMSRFYSEIKRLKATVDLTIENDSPIVFLFDEMLSGTNYHDRAIGAEAVLRSLVDTGAIGVITTHDLTLTKLADDPELHASNVHFQDQFEDGEIIFDHVFHPGVVQRSNALELMRSIGLRIPSSQAN